MKKAKELVKDLGKKYGDRAVTVGLKLEDVERVSTGVFALDLATGGGFPKGKISIVYGPESSGKTNITLVTIAAFQKAYPKEEIVFVDVEHALDPIWCKRLGIDTDKLIHVKPRFGEEGIDMTEAMLGASDVGLVVVDSLASLAPIKEIQGDADRMQVGGNSQLIGHLMRKTVYALSDAEREDRYPAVIFINQIRHKIGMMFGNPEYMPGGNMMRHMSGLTLRFWGKDVVDNAISKVMPVAKKTSVIIQKWKVPIVTVSCEFDMAMLAWNSLRPGQTDDWNTLATYLRDSGDLAKAPKKGWILFEEEFPTLDACKASLYGNEQYLRQVKRAIIAAEVQRVTDLTSLNDVVEEETSEE